MGRFQRARAKRGLGCSRPKPGRGGASRIVTPPWPRRRRRGWKRPSCRPSSTNWTRPKRTANDRSATSACAWRPRTCARPKLDNELGGAQSRLARLLGALELFRRDPPPALFVNPQDVRDAVRAAILIRAIAPQLEQRTATLKAQTLALQRVRRAVDTASEDLFTSESDVADRKAKIEALIAAKAALEGRDTADAQAASQDIDALNARARTLRALSQGLAVAEPPPGAPGSSSILNTPACSGGRKPSLRRFKAWQRGGSAKARLAGPPAPWAGPGAPAEPSMWRRRRRGWSNTPDP